MNNVCCPSSAETPARVAEIPVVAPHANVRRLPAGWKIELELPGVAASDVTVDLDQDLLTVRATRPVPFDADKPARSAEFGTRTYQRAFRVGRGIQKASILANLKHGVLTLDLPFQPEVAPRRIVVES